MPAGPLAWGRRTQRVHGAANSGPSCPPGRSNLARQRQRRPAVRVLVIEDEQVLANAVARGLRHQGMAVDVALDGADALDKATVNHYQVLVLDRDLPGVHGDEVCRQLVAGGGTGRILMLTAAGTVADRVEGLDLGADDYLGKPFAFSELVARVRALGRRGGEATPPLLARGDLLLDRARREASRGGHFLRLTRKELGCWRCCWPPAARWSAPSSCSNGSGTSTPTRSPTPSGSPSATCAASSASRR
jgi:CheY-like chemotaxis protein